eukprot:357767-Chlamydomonas_euryale.AAC.3
MRSGIMQVNSTFPSAAHFPHMSLSLVADLPGAGYHAVPAAAPPPHQHPAGLRFGRPLHTSSPTHTSGHARGRAARRALPTAGARPAGHTCGTPHHRRHPHQQR